MLIALPNLDGSFTVTLFLPHQGAESFASLHEPGRIAPVLPPLLPGRAARCCPRWRHEFLLHPTGIMGTVRCERWSVEDRLLLIGDAAHAITPFHGQGMNCAFEDCRELLAMLDAAPDWASAFRASSSERRPHTNAIADMAIENYLEMRDTVRDPQFHLQQGAVAGAGAALPATLRAALLDGDVSRRRFRMPSRTSVAASRTRSSAQLTRNVTRSAPSISRARNA